MTAHAIKVRTLFAEFGVRMFAMWVDYLLIMILLGIVTEKLLQPAGIQGVSGKVVIPVMLLLYFAAAWSSPLRATPAQLLFGMRVVDESGATLPFGRALLRSLILVVVFVGTLFSFGTASNPVSAYVALPALCLMFLAAVTPNRQALHDLAVRSIVVNRTALNSEPRREKLLAHVADRDPATLGKRRPTIWRMLLDFFVLAVPLALVFTAFSAVQDRSLRTRVYYALDGTEGLQAFVELHYETSGDWPDVGALLPVDKTGRYPDGGFYQLEDDGRIRIQFEVLPRLKKGSIVMVPGLDGDEVTWACLAVDGFNPKLLPPGCRL